MTAVNVPLTIEQGATFVLAFVWSLDSDVEPGTPGDPVDLTGATVRMQIRKTQQSAALIDAKSDGVDPMIVHNGTGGKITIKLPATATDMLTSKALQYDVEVAMADGDVYRVIEGAVTVKPNITQAPGDPVVGA